MTVSTLTLQTMMTFDELNVYNATGGNFCATVSPFICGKGVGASHCPTPSGSSHVASDASWNHSQYALVTGWNGSGLALSAPSSVFYRTANSATHTSWITGCRFKTTSLAAAQDVLQYGQSTVTQFRLLLVQTTGQWRLAVGSGSSPTTICTSVQTLAAGTWAHVEFAYVGNAATGKARVLVNGVTLTWDVPPTNINTGPGTANSVLFNNSVGAYDDVYIYAGDAGYTDDDTNVSATRLPVIDTLRPIASGTFTEWDQYALISEFRTFQALGNSNNWLSLDEIQCDASLTTLEATTANKKDSWIMSALNGAAGEVVEVITSIHIGCDGNFQPDAQGIYIGGTVYEHPDNNNFQYLTPGSSSQFSQRYWPNNPAARGWEPSDFAAFELVTLKVGTGANVFVSQATVFVMWLEALPTEEVEAEDLEAECNPCDEAKNARHLDSFLTYDGENTDLTKTMTLQLAPGADWTTVGLTHTLVSSAPGSFLATDDDVPKKAFRLGDPHSTATVILDVVTYTSATSITVTNRTAVPAALQAVATSVWARMTSKVSGLGHLEGEDVYGNLDGIPYGPWVVELGVVNLTDADDAAIHAAVATVGLQIVSVIETLPLDVPGQAKSVKALQKLVTQVFIECEKSRTLKMSVNHTAGTPSDADLHPYTFLNKDQQENRPWLLVSRNHVFNLPSKWARRGSVYIRHTDALPLTILLIEPRVDTVGKQVD